MKTIKRLLALAIVAGLPIACGTDSPTGIDVAALNDAQSAKGRRPATAPVFVPPPPQVPEGDDGARVCTPVVAEILVLRGNFPEPLYQESVLLYMAMLDKDGREARAGTCNRVRWGFDRGFAAAGAIITVGADTRYASVAGAPGGYRIRATAPNGLTTTVAITLR
jgi:hypothetical protein